MIEKLAKAACNALIASGYKLAARTKDVSPGVWAVLIVAILMITRGSWYFYNWHVGHRDEIAKDIGSTRFFYGLPQPNASGSRLLYLRTSENGLGIFAKDVADGNDQLLREWPGLNYVDKHDQISSFSPDGNLFAYSFMTNDPFNPSSMGYIAICQSDSGEELARIPAVDWNVAGIAWLTSDKLICRCSRHWGQWGPAFDHYLVQRQSDGSWTATNLNLVLTEPVGLAVLPPEAFAWADVDGLHIFNTSSNTARLIFKPRKGRIVGICYSRETGRFLMTIQEEWKRGMCSLWSLAMGKNDTNSFIELASEDDVHNAQWVNGGRGYAYLNGDRLVVKNGEHDESVRLNDATVEGFNSAANGRDLFLFGRKDTDPSYGVWRYNIEDQILTNVIPYSDSPSAYTTQVEPTEYLDNEVHPALDYYIYKPTHFSLRKKYPLLLGDTPITEKGRPALLPFLPEGLNRSPFQSSGWVMAMADSGAYVVVINRTRWDKGIEEWGEDVMHVYKRLQSDPTIDREKIYLYSTSLETEYMSKLIERRPDLWKGALFLNPSGLPDLSAIKSTKTLPKMFISAGAYEEESERFSEFQEKACARGAFVTIQQLPQTGHFLVSISAFRERTRAIVSFAFNN